MPETTTDPTATEVAREYFDRYPGLLHILRLGHATEETLGHAATLVRAALAAAPAVPDDAHTETVTEYRVVGRSGPGMSVEVVEGYSEADLDMARDQAQYCVEDGWVEVAVQSRTVTTSRRESEWKATDQ